MARLTTAQFRKLNELYKKDVEHMSYQCIINYTKSTTKLGVEYGDITQSQANTLNNWAEKLATSIHFSGC